MNTQESGPTVFVMLPVHNRCAISTAFARCLVKQTYAPVRLLLIDDGSTDGTAAAVKAIYPHTEVIRGQGNWWWAGSLQKGREWLLARRVPRDQVVLVMNDDTEFDAQFIEDGLAVLAGHPDTLLTATGYNIDTGQAQDSGAYVLDWKTMGFRETYNSSEANCSSTRGLMSRVGDFLDVGDFYVRRIPHYLSDLEFTMRACRLGKKLAIDPRFRIGIDFKTTGTRELSQSTFRVYLREVFSRRSAMNPVAWSHFALLHSPRRHVLRNLRMIWGAVYQQGVRERLIPDLRRLVRGGRPRSGPRR